MNNVTSVLLKAAALAGGAVVGTVLSHLLDELISAQSSKEDEVKLRYVRGLGPQDITPGESREPIRMVETEQTEE